MPVIRKLVAFCCMYEVPGFEDLFKERLVSVGSISEINRERRF